MRGIVHMHSEDMQLMMVEMRCCLVAATDGWAAVARLLKVGLGGVVFQHSSLLFVKYVGVTGEAGRGCML